ncbi:MAG: hypothetical protein KJZ85_15920 [Rhodobacteraceae bacterium]|jgi:hypothetical protein|nr:hypothetical protein [Paracoccaceae bacterium]
MTRKDKTPENPPEEASEIICPFSVEVAPADIRPGDPLTLTFALADPEGAEPLVGLDIVVLDDTGGERGRVAIARNEDRLPAIEPLEIEAPHAPGTHRWRARLDLPEPEEGEEPLEVGTDLELAVAAHRPSVTVWDVPSVVERGRPFRFRLGIKCPLGCDSAGWAFAVRDAAGRDVAAGAVGADPWPGTAGLHHAEISLAAPQTDGLSVWTVVALGRDAPCAHLEHATQLRLHVGPPAEHRLRITVLDAASRAPVARAKVVAHPYRAVTDAQGVAEVRLPSGHYRIFVSGKPYFAMNTEAEVTGDLDLEVGMHVDREFGVEDQYV